MHIDVDTKEASPVEKAVAVDASVTVAIAAGGTGGHIYPGLAVAAALREHRPGARVVFVGTPYGMESELVPLEGYPLHLVNMAPFARQTRWRRYLASATTARAVWQSRRILVREAVDVVVGMGGYPSLPVVAAARLVGVPAVVHESNAVPGRANRLSAQLTSNVALAMAASAGRWAGEGARVVGMPIDAAMRSFHREELRAVARRRYGVDAGTMLVVVSGGSQGSARLDGAALELACAWRERSDVRLLVKASRGAAEELRRRIAACEAERVATVVAYFDRMAEVYAAADLMICRAGAATVAELALVGLPAVMVPYPHAPGDHQTRNAQALVAAGAAVMVPDAQASGPSWCALVDDLLGDPARRAAMAGAAADAVSVDGADRLAGWALELALAGKSVP